MLYVTYDDEYVAVRDAAGSGRPFLLGPVDAEFADTAVEGVARMLEALGHRVVTADTAPPDLLAAPS